MSKITFTNKETLNENTSIEAKHKGRADDWNEVKTVVNGNDDIRIADEKNITALLKSLGLYVDTFSTGTAYAVDDFVVYQNKLWRFTSTKTAGAWDGTKVVEDSILTSE